MRLNDVKNAESLVRHIMRTDYRTRSNDLRLILAYWRAQGWDIQVKDESTFIHKADTPETITRTRRLIHSRHQLLPHDKVVTQRQLLDEKMKEDIRGERA